MRKWIIAFSLLAALLGLAGCGGPEEQAATPAICYYNGSYYNSEGQKLVEFGTDCRILCDAQGHSCYLLQKLGSSFKIMTFTASWCKLWSCSRRFLIPARRGFTLRRTAIYLRAFLC